MRNMASPHPKKARRSLRGSALPNAPAFKYRPQFGIVVMCCDEARQRLIYNWLNERGLDLKVVCV